MNQLQSSMLLVLMSVAVSLLSTCHGLRCDCTADCQGGENTCETGAGGVCYTQLILDVSGRHAVLRKGCLDDSSSPICRYSNSNAHKNKCCNDTDLCNADLFQTDPPTISCACINNRKCNRHDQCTLASSKHSCYMTIHRIGSHISYVQGCVKRCHEKHTDDEKTICCRGDLCNNHDVPSVWPSSTSSAVAPTTSSYSPPSLTEATTATPTGPTQRTNTQGELIIPGISTTQQPGTTLDPRQPHEKKLTCHCSTCQSPKTCEATEACALYRVGQHFWAACVQDEFTCTNDTFQIDCCYEDFCNRGTTTTTSSTATGPPCDDEDTEQSGCGDGSVTLSTTSTMLTTSTSIAATPTSTSRAVPTATNTNVNGTKQDPSSKGIIIFYFFIALLTVCILLMLIVIMACIVMVCHYRSMASKTTLSSTTILESSIKEKSYPISSSPV